MKQYRKAVSALVLKATDVCSPDGCKTLDEILLVHKPRLMDSWQLPQGGIEAGETCEKAALRELKEETGLRTGEVIFRSAETYCYDFPTAFVERFAPVNNGQTLRFVVIRVPKDAQVRVDVHEVDSYAWVTREQLPQYIKREGYLEIIEKVFEEAMGNEL